MNRIRRIVITFLVVIVVAGIIHFTSKPAAAKLPVEIAPSTTDMPELRSAGTLPARPEKKLTVYYLANDKTNQDNSYNESFVRKTIEQYFSPEIKSNLLAFQIINADSQEYPKLTQKFKTAAPAVILEIYSGSKTAERKNIELIGFKNQTVCAEYIVSEINILLNK